MHEYRTTEMIEMALNRTYDIVGRNTKMFSIQCSPMTPLSIMNMPERTQVPAPMPMPMPMPTPMPTQ